jgi:hypothetical protein
MQAVVIFKTTPPVAGDHSPDHLIQVFVPPTRRRAPILALRSPFGDPRHSKAATMVSGNSGVRRRTRDTVLAGFATGALLAGCNVGAVEGGGSNYLLGMRGPLAAFVPKPGVYLTDNVYYYDAGRSELTPIGDRVVGEVSAEALMNIAQFSWVTDVSVLGGRLAFSGVLPYGTIEVAGNAFVPGAGFTIGDSDDVTALGDPVLGASVGWKHRDGDRFRAWSVYSSVFIPAGDYEVGRLANTGKNRWAFDAGAAYTMANFKGGRELSAVLGFTFNGENDDTDYDSGNEMHLEVAAKQYLPNHFSLGLVGYWNEQLTADSGGPALLGDFKGHVLAIGPELSYQFTQSKTHPLTIDLRWYHEFDAQNRVEGDGVFLTFSVPLSVQQKPEAGQDWSQADASQ